jgi:hypothetical protein
MERNAVIYWATAYENAIAGAEIVVPTSGGLMAWGIDLDYPCVLEQPAKDEFEVVK